MEGSGCIPSLCGEIGTIEGNFGLPRPICQAVEDHAMLLGCLHQLEEVFGHALWGAAVDAYMIMYCNYASKIVCCLSMCI